MTNKIFAASISGALPVMPYIPIVRCHDVQVISWDQTWMSSGRPISFPAGLRYEVALTLSQWRRVGRGLLPVCSSRSGLLDLASRWSPASRGWRIGVHVAHERRTHNTLGLHIPTRQLDLNTVFPLMRNITQQQDSSIPKTFSWNGTGLNP